MRQEISIAQLGVGNQGTIVRFDDQAIAQKLICMGLLPGKRVAVVRSAPFSGGFYLKVDGHRIAVREYEAESVIINCD
ncbi:MAG: FeoA family protein [Bacteroidota bacterium]